MQTIVFDLEFNQDDLSLLSNIENKSQCPYEIIQIGAIRLDANFNTVNTFDRYVKPSIYSRINPFVTDLTGITTDQLLFEEAFPSVFENFIAFIGTDDPAFCIWGMSDIKELFRNTQYHQLDKKRLPDLFINLQPYVSTYLGFTQAKLLNLQAAVEALRIRMPYQFHNALYDAYYTAELLKKVYTPLLQFKHYDPAFTPIRPRQRKKVVDFEKLILQFEKMYAREISEEEQDMIKLAYKMGKTNQFIKE